MDIFNSAVSVLSLVVIAVGTFIALRSLRGNTHKNIKEDGEWKGKVDTLLESIVKDLERIGEELTELRKIVFSRFGNSVISSDSPLRLTAFGETISREITAQAWVERVADSLYEDIKGMDAYEIQVFCFEYVESTDEYSNEEQKAIRHAAYKRGIKTKDIRQVLAIELRDKLLKNAGLEAL
ncbi:MAG: hypothetical protein OXD43_05725 [Bacteroidetes bacterium]|nr:hypothetical protein [Bacteroidota bacterium]